MYNPARALLEIISNWENETGSSFQKRASKKPACTHLGNWETTLQAEQCVQQIWDFYKTLDADPIEYGPNLKELLTYIHRPFTSWENSDNNELHANTLSWLHTVAHTIDQHNATRQLPDIPDADLESLRSTFEEILTNLGNIDQQQTSQINILRDYAKRALDCLNHTVVDTELLSSICFGFIGATATFLANPLFTEIIRQQSTENPNWFHDAASKVFSTAGSWIFTTSSAAIAAIAAQVFTPVLLQMGE